MFAINPISWLILAQNAAPPGGKAGGNPGLQSILPFAPLIFLVLLFYMMILRPEQRKRARHRDLLNQLKKNDRIVTIGGIVGKITNLHEGGNEVTIVTDENTNTKLRILRSAISQVLLDKDHPEGES